MKLIPGASRFCAFEHQPDYYEISEIAQIDELQTVVGKKKTCIWRWRLVNKAIAGIIAIVICSRNAETFKPLWQIVKGWQCFFM
ncbi:hypothetical protein QUB30_27130 [Microcoleus sp. BROC3]